MKLFDFEINLTSKALKHIKELEEIKLFKVY